MSDVNIIINMDRDSSLRLAVSTNSDMSSPAYFGPTRTHKYTAKIAATGLSADTVYYYCPEADGVLLTAQTGQFRTPVSGAHSFKFCFSSCNDSGSNHASFATVEAEDPLFFAHLGDIHYEDIGTNSPHLFEAAMSEFFGSENPKSLFESVPIVYMYDDHDFGDNDSFSGSPSREAAIAHYRARVPSTPLAAQGATDAVYHTFEIGRVVFIVTDLRADSSSKDDTDDASKSKMGATQKAWFKSILSDADNAEKFFFWLSTSPWVPDAGVGLDHWGGFSTERTEIADFVKANCPGRIMVLSGDTHALAIDDGTNGDFATGGGGAIREFTASPMDKTNGTWTATYSSGYFQNNGQYGVVEVADTGGADITVTLTGKKSDNVVLVTDSFTVSLSAATEFTITVGSGTVGADLTDFPLMVDLEDMPTAFWGAVDSDGANIRVYASDGTTLVPHDLTHIDGTLSRGRLFVKTTLLTGSDVSVVVKLDGAGGALAVDNANGRNAVWTDFDTVVVFPEQVNRTDGGAADVASTKLSTFKWKETDAQDVNTGQGVAFDGTHYYSVDTNALRKYAARADTATGTILAVNSDPAGDVNTEEGITNLNHCGAPDIIDGELWVPVEEYPNFDGYDTQYIARYALADLSFIGSFQLTGATRESSCVFYDSALDRLYVTDFVNDDTIPYFTKAGAYAGAIALSSDIESMQGFTRVGDKYFVGSAIDGVYEIDLDGTNNGVVLESEYVGDHESVFHRSGDLIVAQDSGYVRHFRTDTPDHDWARIHGEPLGFETAKSEVWTLCVSWLPTPDIDQQGIMGVYRVNSTTDRHSLMFDKGPDRIDAWNPSDSWFAPNPDVNPVPYTAHRAGLGQNGTTQRRLFVDGDVNDTDNGSSARPTGSNDMVFAIAGGAGNEDGFGSYQFAWARKEYMAVEWMAADAANFSAPSSFYTVTSS